jgi:transcriptional regulator with XRE-family HTH domain
MTKTIFQNETFGKAIKQKRVIEMDVDLRTLSKKLKISPATLSRCENGNAPDLNTYALLCDWLNASKDDFFAKPIKKK